MLICHWTAPTMHHWNDYNIQRGKTIFSTFIDPFRAPISPKTSVFTKSFYTESNSKIVSLQHSSEHLNWNSKCPHFRKVHKQTKPSWKNFTSSENLVPSYPTGLKIGWQQRSNPSWPLRPVLIDSVAHKFPVDAMFNRRNNTIDGRDPVGNSKKHVPPTKSCGFLPTSITITVFGFIPFISIYHINWWRGFWTITLPYTHVVKSNSLSKTNLNSSQSTWAETIFVLCDFVRLATI